MKKIIFVLCCFISLFCCIPTNNSLLAEKKLPTSVRVVANSTYIYTSESLSSEILIEITCGTILNVCQDSNNNTYFKVKTFSIVSTATSDDFGFVLQAHVLDTNVASPAKKLESNATIKNNNSKVYKKISDTYSDTGISLEKGTPVRILDGYLKTKQYTYISFVYNDNIVSYYVLTSDLNVKGINYSVITAVSTLITCLAVLSLVFGLKNRKKSKARK